MSHSLDRPIWSALAGEQAALGEGDERARRFLPSVSPFAATVDDTDESFQSLRNLVRTGGTAVMIQAGAVRLPEGLVPARTAEAVQMIAERPVAVPPDPRIEGLGGVDVADMLELARLTSPGPLTSRALDLGRFWGIRREGRLVAMAGERLRQPGFTEVSGVCTHPDARGEGLARLLSLHVAAAVRKRGDVPYLHAYATNVAAIRLYETIGFGIRSTMHVAVIDLSA